MLLKYKGNDTEDKEQGAHAYVNAWIRDKEAKEKHPGLDQMPHTKDVLDIQSEVIAFTGFKLKQTSNSSNMYQNARFHVEGEIGGPATVLKFDFGGQKSFTQKDGASLHSHLKTKFPKNKLNVIANPTRPVCLVHVGL